MLGGAGRRGSANSRHQPPRNALRMQKGARRSNRGFNVGRGVGALILGNDWRADEGGVDVRSMEVDGGEVSGKPQKGKE